MAQPNFFTWTQGITMNLYDHYTAKKAIAKMQNSPGGSWENGTFQNLYFPDAPAAPPVSSADSTDYQGAANAFVSQVIHNGDYTEQSCSNWDKAQAAIDKFNSDLYNNNFDRFVDWFSWDESLAITGPHMDLETYRKHITDPNWINLKAGEQASGTWYNQSFDMFMHFLKLTAIGATDADIKAIYNKLTVRSSPADPILDPSGFFDVTGDTYKNYRAYLVNEGLTCDMLKLDSTNFGQVYYFNPRPNSFSPGITYYADDEFLRQSGYYQDPPSGCCFAAETRVVLADNKVTKKIQDIQPGDQVLSPTKDNPFASKACLFVSKPPRNGRSLYSYSGQGHIKFTATHPFLSGYDEFGLPKLAVVDSQSSLSVDPLLAAFSVEEMPPRDLVQMASRHSPEDDDENLFDIVFSGDALSTYVVEDSKGQRRVVCSEAPSATLLPNAAGFFLGFAHALKDFNDQKRFFPNGLGAGVIRYMDRVRKIRRTAVQKHSTLSDEKPVAIVTEHFASAFTSGKLPAQVVADSVEAVITRMGLSIQSELDNFWLHKQSEDNTTVSLEVLSTHFIRLNPGARDTEGNNLAKSFYNVTNSISIASAFGKFYPIITRSIGPYLYHNHSVAVLPHEQQGKTIALDIQAGNVTLVAYGAPSEHGALAKWPMHLKNSTNSSHVGWISVSAGKTSPKSFAGVTNNGREYSGTTGQYGHLLGTELANDIISSLS